MATLLWQRYYLNMGPIYTALANNIKWDVNLILRGWCINSQFLCFYGCFPEGRKWVSHKGFCLTSGNRTNVPTSLGRVNPNTAAAEIRTRRLACHQAATRTQADWNSVCPRRNPGVRTAPGRTPGIVRTLCRPFWAFRWFPIHKPSSNSTVPVAWITEPATDSRYELV